MNRAWTILIRILSGVGGLCVGCLLFGLPLSWDMALIGGGWLFVFYLCIRPLMQLIILPLNLLALGILTLVTDALLVLWAAAWTPHLQFTYGQAFLIAACIGLCRLLLEHPQRKHRFAWA